MRVWTKGTGAKVGFFAGIGGLPRWSAFLDKLAETRCVVAPSLPGFPGGPAGDKLDDNLDRIVAAHDALVAAGLVGADLIGASVGGALAAKVAALWPGDVKKLALIAPFGLFDESEPVADIFAQRPGAMSAALSSKPPEFDAFLAAPEGMAGIDWQVSSLRANVAAANIIWPLGDTGLSKRLDRITAPTLLLWGDGDRVIPPSYAEKFAARIKGKASIRKISGAGHLADFDQPVAVAAAVEGFLAG
jgi:pimeloyl-ACP methyl ester carboxylesterase